MMLSLISWLLDSFVYHGILWNGMYGINRIYQLTKGITPNEILWKKLITVIET